MKIFGLLILNLLLLGCARPASDNSQSTTGIERQVLIGTWQLAKVAGANPNKFEIQSWQIQFIENGDMRYWGSMTGSFAGMQLEGSGTWKLENNQLQYTIGKKVATSTLTAHQNVLTLSPDPVIRRDGVSEVETTYAKKE